MSTRIQKNRSVAYQKQNGCCFYCGAPMFMDEPDEFIKFHSISKNVAKMLKCTAEHLTARCDGGKDSQNNIVAACKFCNQNRHKRKKAPDPDNYKKQITNRVRKGKWHSKEILYLISKMGVNPQV